MEKIKLFTHTDLDGLGCEILAKHQFADENLSVSRCGYHNINQEVVKFINNEDLSEYSAVYITDISVDKDVAIVLDTIDETQIVLLDHHKSAESLNIYDWASVWEKDPISGTKVCGTSMFSDYLITKDANVLDFVEYVRLYDTWEWKAATTDTEILNGTIAKRLNDLIGIYGSDKFVKDMGNKLLSKYFNIISSFDEVLLGLEEMRIDKYIDSLNIHEIPFKRGDKPDFNCILVFADKYISEVGSVLGERYDDRDLVIIVNMNKQTVSYRTIHKDVDVTELAELYGGGGHPMSAGSPLSDTKMEQVIKTIGDEWL